MLRDGRTLVYAAAGLVAAACWSGCGDPGGRARVYFDEGAVCLVADADGRDGSVQAGDEAFVRVVFDGRASQCADVGVASCAVARQGSVLRVTSQAEVTEEIDEDGDCPAVCRVVQATCPIGALPRGRYELQLGEQTRAVEVPGEDRCDCSTC